ncbi:MAG: hypothetical protein OEV27_13255 [Nitrospira sp.]|nr:hypothetical protein [Nitrospira sp.]MDH4252143.1 hypothetical protein [Nitrospira sp.]MDH4344439.1 hypothetical protein [Nitrospira sp.]MDH5337564.1 hypothetical protein [Nitrospira sp.]
MKTTAQKWGNSLVILMPKRVADGAGLPEKAIMEVEVRKGTLASCAAASAASLSTGRPVDMYQAMQCSGGSRF